jgi:RNA polymerase sigma-70 factor (ECF subfamily)
VRKPLAFLYGIAAHVLADFNMEKASEQEHLTFDDEAVRAWSQSPAGMSPEELAERLNLQQQIQRALAQLPRMHAAVLLAHKRDGLSYREVAQRLNLSVHTVEKYLTQAKARIRMMSWDT